jgi:deoxyribonuclease IV
MKRFLGGHTVESGGIEMAVRRAGAAGMDALQIFTAPPRFYGDRAGIRPERVERFRTALDEVGIDPGRVLVHGAYVLGVATPDPEKWARASQGLKKEMERSTLLGAGAVCFHPGSSSGTATQDAAARVARAITEALRAVDGETRLLVENTAGAGSTLGRTAEEIAAILAHVPAELRSRTGYGLDTCHLYSSGFDLGRSPTAVTEILDEFERVVGEPPSFFHLNDSEGKLGSNRDRHMLIGEGEIGIEPFRALLRDPRRAGIPLVLETPQENPEIDRLDASADPWDLEMMKLLRSLLPGAGDAGV